VPRDDATFDDLGAVSWLQNVLLPIGVFIAAVAIVAGLVLSGVVQGHKTYSQPAGTSTTQATVLIAP
jgi:hypothetical protein